ncbi:MAG: hypothetical protein K1W31_09720 [Lachnospiraceae bacterium]
MLYYLGKGTEFKKEECKEYKTIEGALRAAAKDEEFVVWDETGKIVGGLTDNVPEGALKPNPDGSVPAFDESGHPIGAVDAATVAAATGQQETQKATGEGAETATDGQNGAEPEKSTPETENAGNGANTKPEESKTIIPQGTMRVTVICDGTLNLRRSADWGNGNICGRASRGQTYYVKAIHTVQGKKMVQTIDDVYLSGQSEHVQFEQL